jgi:hypothetical protein
MTLHQWAQELLAPEYGHPRSMGSHDFGVVAGNGGGDEHKVGSRNLGRVMSAIDPHPTPGQFVGRLIRSLVRSRNSKAEFQEQDSDC